MDRDMARRIMSAKEIPSWIKSALIVLKRAHLRMDDRGYQPIYTEHTEAEWEAWKRKVVASGRIAKTR